MSVVCGKRCFFEELASPLVVKRARFSASSPSRHVSRSSDAALKPPSSVLIDHLTSVFPAMDKKVLARALEECGDDLDLAIKKLNELQFGCANNNMGGADASHQSDHPSANNGTEENLAKNGTEWVELFVKEMASATHMDDARARAARALESLQKSLLARLSAENFQQEENTTRLKEQVQVLNHQNTILKRAVTIQHEHQKEFEHKAHELQRLKELIPQYQEQIRILEVNNYALSVHLKQTQQNTSIPGRFHPHIF